LNIIKKLVVLVLVVFVLSFSLTGFSEENVPKYIISDNLKMYNELLSKIGVVESDFLTADNNDTAITKEEFLVLMFKLLNFKFDDDEASLAEEVILSDKDNMGSFDDYTYGTGNQSKSSTEIKFEPVVWFVDVPVENPNFTAVSMALGMGMISSNNEKRFYPQKNISINEATKMLVSTLGYRVIAESNGGYPTG
jgi:hypothetical protein